MPHSLRGREEESSLFSCSKAPIFLRKLCGRNGGFLSFPSAQSLPVGIVDVGRIVQAAAFALPCIPGDLGPLRLLLDRQHLEEPVCPGSSDYFLSFQQKKIPSFRTALLLSMSMSISDECFRLFGAQFVRSVKGM